MTPTPGDLARQAAEWLVALDADSPAQRQAARAGFENWKQADPRHAAAAAPFEELRQQMAALREDPAQGRSAQRALQAGLHAAQAQRQARGRRTPWLACAAAALALGLGGGYAALHSDWGLALHADLRTGTGEWRAQALPDGTQLMLGSDSAVDWHDGPRLRALHLLRGEILVQVAPDADRPLEVRTPQARIRALGTQLLVRRGDGVTRLALLESAAAVQPTAPATPHETVVGAGEQVDVAAGEVRALAPVDPERLRRDWERRELVVIDQPLPEVLRTLARHRPGHLGFDEAGLAHLRVTAVLPLDAPDRALELLATSFPQLRMSRFTDYWVSIGLRERGGGSAG